MNAGLRVLDRSVQRATVEDWARITCMVQEVRAAVREKRMPEHFDIWAWMRRFTAAQSATYAARLVLGTFHRENPDEATVPVPVVNLARWLSADVVFQSSGHPKGPGPTIIVDSTAKREDQRYAIACELGFGLCYSPELKTEFAMELLMPTPWLTAEVYLRDADVSRLAHMFRVPEHVVFERLKQLRLA